MYLTYRAAKPPDFPRCFDLLTNQFVFNTPQLKKDLLAFWGKTLADRSAIAFVIEDMERPAEKRIVGFSFVLFPTDSFVQEACTTQAPFLALQILRSWLKNKKVFLDRKSTALQNAGEGVNLTIIHYGLEKGGSFEAEQPVRAKIFEAGVFFTGGYRIREILQEDFGVENTAPLRQAGLLQRRDYAELKSQGAWTDATQPFLFGINREESTQSAALANLLFVQPRPRFGFTLGEQDALEKALLGDTDEAIAKSLGLTVWAVKKRWQAIYAKVEKMDPSFLEKTGTSQDDSPESSRVRRRLLLEYLRNHLEEIRPFTNPARGKKKKA